PSWPATSPPVAPPPSTPSSRCEIKYLKHPEAPRSALKHPDDRIEQVTVKGDGMTRSLVTFGAALAAAIGLAAGSPVAQQQPAADQAMVAKARQIHDKVITLDTHVDMGVNNFTAERNYTQELSTQVDLPKMLKGG